MIELHTMSEKADYNLSYSSNHNKTYNIKFPFIFCFFGVNRYA
jgi:hypothetical protein